MKNRILAVLSLTLLLALLICGCADSDENAKVSDTKKNDTDTVTATVSKSKADPDGEDTKLFTFFKDREFSIGYKETSAVNGVPVDVYVDSAENEYKYNSEGELIALDVKNIENGDGKDVVDIHTAKTIGLTFALRSLGDEEYKKYTGRKSIRENEGEPMYTVNMSKTYGEEGFVNGPLLTVNVDSYGNVVSYDRGDTGVFYQYDYTDVDVLTKTNVIDAVREKIDDICVSGYDEVEIYWCLLEDHNGEATANLRLTLTNKDGVKIKFQHEDVVEVHQYNGSSAVGITIYHPLQDILDSVKAN